MKALRAAVAAEAALLGAIPIEAAAAIGRALADHAAAGTRRTHGMIGV